MISQRIYYFFYVCCILLYAETHASDICQKQWKCDQYQTKKLGPNYSFPFTHQTQVHDSELKDNDLSGIYVNSLVRIHNLSNKDFSKSFWVTPKTLTDITNSNFSHSVMRGFHARDIQIINSNFAFSDLFGSALIGVRIVDSSFEHANLKFCDLGFSIIKRVNLKGSDLRDCNLIGTKFINVVIDEKTQFPKNFNLNRIK